MIWFLLCFILFLLVFCGYLLLQLSYRFDELHEAQLQTIMYKTAATGLAEDYTAALKVIDDLRQENKALAFRKDKPPITLNGHTYQPHDLYHCRRGQQLYGMWNLWRN